MASTSAPHPRNSGAARIASAANNLSSDKETLISDIRKSLNMIKSIAVDLEKEQQSEKVKQMEDAVLELLQSYDDCARFSDSIRSVSSKYQPSDEVTDFKQLLENEFAMLKAASSFDPQSNPMYRGFKEAVWNVHHAGQPMPGEEQEDIIMTSTQNNILNSKCPLTGKPVFELQDPVRCLDCKHIYEKDAIILYIRQKQQPRCPITGCPKVLQEGRVVCDAELKIDIEEMHSAENEAVQATVVEDFTDVDDSD
ncbi:E3 SUMO-protein ligase MMS21 [Iris pallida]|uniref:E3 SUMO-protein ligase MMS21 n=1 Tax=Iris pallida TaxID=29817 RepID=A0AAX6IDY6_IRIPA|nr:E3 SUMO-protein ligase MMS21 [Iris pallida]KAJ6851004.1 E3 SUMO-protein ligase MMS21 [Iris pallida]